MYLTDMSHDLEAEKTAADKAAEAPTPGDPGGYAGASTHASTSVDNRGQAATEGARSAENVSDVNEDQGALGVNQAKDAVPGCQDEAQLNIGTQSSATGEDPSVEDDYKGGKDDPGSTHPARTDNDSLDGHKYANASLAELKTATDALSNGILADMINGQTLQKTAEEDGVCDTGAATLNPAAAGDKPPKQPKQQVAGEGLEEKVAEGKPPAAADPRTWSGETQRMPPIKGHPYVSGPNLQEKSIKSPPAQSPPEVQKATPGHPVPLPPGQKLATAGSLDNKIAQATAAVQAEKLAHSQQAANTTEQAYLAGYELAAGLGLEKTAAEQLVADGVEAVISDAQMDAELFASYFQAHVKRAMDEDAADEGEDHSQEGDDTSGAGDAEGAGGETDGGPGGSEPTDAGPTTAPAAWPLKAEAVDSAIFSVAEAILAA